MALYPPTGAVLKADVTTADRIKRRSGGRSRDENSFGRQKGRKTMRRATLICLTVAGLVFILAASFAQICAQPPQGIVSWWTVEGDVKDSVGANHGSLENGAGFGIGM